MDAPQNADRDSSQPLKASLQAGLAALKQKNYLAAIAHLRACQTSPDAATRLKAEMGLVKAYVRTHQNDAAIPLCQLLQDHPNPQVQAWVRQTLTELHSVSPPIRDAESNDITGFVPRSSEPRIAPQPDPTGFVARADASRVGVPHSSRTHSPPASASPAVPSQKTRFTNRPQPPQVRSSPPEATPPSPPSLIPTPPLWRNAGRSSKWSTLGAVDASGLWALQVGSVALLFWLLDTLTRWLLATWNSVSIWMYVLIGIPRLLLPTNLSGAIAVILFGLVAASPWLLDVVLRQYKRQPFSLAQLEQSAPEASRLLKRVCGQRHQPVPTLHLLPTAAPLAFTYGYLSQQSRLVLSQGLLDQLNDDEIAAILAGELAHLRYWDFGIMSALTLIAQLPYLVYWHVANWGNRQPDRVLQTVAAAVSSLAYGLFWLLRLPTLWLSRVRLYYSDRWAAELTGNPNGLTRALLKSAIGIAQDIQQQQHTSPLLESFEMLMPVGYRTALTLGSLYAGDPTLLNWDRLNPDTAWLIINNTHPPLGDRCSLLMHYAQTWRLPPELNWDIGKPSLSPSPKSKIQNPKSLHRRLLLQGAPFFGIPVGLMAAFLLWMVGWLAGRLGWAGLSWLAGDRSILVACCLLGFSIGMFLRINPFFPDIKRSTLETEPVLATLLTDPQALPVDSYPVRLPGTLLGRRGFLNWLYQDLMLQTPTGVIRLHYTSRGGWLGDLFPKAMRPPALINQSIVVTGWFRRGATPWIDVETLQTPTGKTLRSHHPIWSTLVASAAALLAIYVIFRGGS
ncbi:MAG: M48 family metalloprotease [Cyanobacteria bacterium RM1_2_2]|nr:M48 family metalloprotease [Cyanobacteria bacterium RM1_2_2]